MRVFIVYHSLQLVGVYTSRDLAIRAIMEESKTWDLSRIFSDPGNYIEETELKNYEG